MKYDPHDNSFIAKNLREEEWFEYQRSDEIKALVEQIKTITVDQVAVVSNLLLMKLEFQTMAEANTAAIFMQDPSGHWAAIAIAMMAHCYFIPGEGVIRFYRSPYDQEPMYYNNIEYIKEQGFHNLVPARIRHEAKDTGATGYGQDNSSHGTSRKRDSKRDETGQGSLFDLHPGSSDGSPF
jgi:hypothetical protein